MRSTPRANGPFGTGPGRRLSEIRGGLSNTFAVSEIAQGELGNSRTHVRSLGLANTGWSRTREELLAAIDSVVEAGPTFPATGSDWLVPGLNRTWFNCIDHPGLGRLYSIDHDAVYDTQGGSFPPSSFHLVAANAAMLDGSTRTLNGEIDRLVMWQLGGIDE